MEPGAMTLNDYFDILKRRKWSIILPSLIIFVAATIIALALPSIFKSTSTILIVEQEIPSNFVMATVTSFAEQRLQSIKQRIMSTTRLLEIVKQFNLYSELKDKWTTEEIIGKMRKDIKLDTISADVVDRRTGRPMTATIAFTLSYEGKNAAMVQRVANVLASLYLEENLKVRERQTIETYTFLENEMEKVKLDLAEIEKKIAVFKEKHINELPELLQVNVQNLDFVERNIERFQEQFRSLKEREGYLQTQLAGIPLDESVNKDKKRLEDIRMELVYLKSRFTDEYPDVIKIKAEIAALEEQAGNTPDVSELPNVIKSNEQPDNPAYITLASQLASTRIEIDSIKKQIIELKEKGDRYRQRIENTPRLEQEYNVLNIERNNTQAKFDDLMKKFMEARVAHGLEKEQKGERFTLIDPARLPEKPFKPNRMAIVLIGFVLGIGAGIGMGAIMEFSDHAVRNAGSLAGVTSFPVLASIPEIITKKDIIRKRVKRIIQITAVLIVIAAGIAAFHYLVMDLNVFWAKLTRKMARYQL